jgi:hypothetical protein
MIGVCRIQSFCPICPKNPRKSADYADFHGLGIIIRVNPRKSADHFLFVAPKSTWHFCVPAYGLVVIMAPPES